MRHVARKRAPKGFSLAVTTPGNQWLTNNGFDLAKPLPPKTLPPPLWRKYIPKMHLKYQGICAYLGVYMEPAIGGISIDHFIAKSSRASGTYDWKNYRLACSMVNSKKGVFDGILDPFTLPDVPELFHLELGSGRIFVNPLITGNLSLAASQTIKTLGLDRALCRAMRARHFRYYTEGLTKSSLKEFSPFVYSECERQGLL